MTRAVLEERLAKVREAHARKQAAVHELVAQINALNGREQELTELLALLETDGIPRAD